MKETANLNYEFVWILTAYDNAALYCVGKIKKLMKGYRTKLHVLVLNHHRFTDRRYWLSSPEISNGYQENESQALQQFVEEIQNALGTNVKGANVNLADIEVLTRPRLQEIYTKIEGIKNLIWLIGDSPMMRKEPFFQNISQCKQPLLLLTESEWKAPIKVVAAVDPLHEKSRPIDLDEWILRFSRKLTLGLSAQMEIVHSCYISPVSMKYKKQIIEVHMEGLQELVKQLKMDSQSIRLLTGNPESALKHYVDSESVSVLTLGLTARGWLEELFVGSTTMELLYDPPCDLFLVPQL